MDEIRVTGKARAIAWADLAVDRPMDLVERRRVHGRHMTVARLTLKKGFKIDPHAHPEEQIAVMLSGKMRFLVGEPGKQETKILVGGQILVLPPGVPHGAEALEETEVLDLFSPAAVETGLDQADS